MNAPPATIAAGLIGQERMLAVIEAAAARPVHAYLVAGPRGAGAEIAARCLAGRLLGADERSWRLIERGMHPDVVEFEPAGATYSVEELRKVIIPETMRVPVEGDYKAVIVRDAERLSANRSAGNAFLKALEEPPPRTVIILVTVAVDDLLPTIRSRCSRVDLDAVGDDEVEAALIADGVEPAAATRAAALAGGQVARARALAGRLAELRFAFASAPGRLDGTGATVAAVAADLHGELERAAEEVVAAHEAELVEFDAAMVRQGYAPREAQRLRKRVEARQKREARRARIDHMLEGLGAIESVVFDVLQGGEVRNDDIALPSWSPWVCADALAACRKTRDAVVVNEKGTLQLEHLLFEMYDPR